jgi:hypothetical protein
MTTQTTAHKLSQIIITPIILVEQDGSMVPVPDPEGEETVNYGCTVCNMGIEEAQEVNCPGFDIFDDSQFTE